MYIKKLKSTCQVKKIKNFFAFHKKIFQFLKADKLNTLSVLEGHIDMLATVSWDDGKSFAVNLNVKYQIGENEVFFEMSSRLNTPLDSLKNMKLYGMYVPKLFYQNIVSRLVSL